MSDQSLVVTVHDIDVDVIEYDGQRVVTLAMIDNLHGRHDGTARKRFNSNKRRFIEGRDFFVCSSSVLRTGYPGAIPSSLRDNVDITLITESGYSMLVKSFTDDRSWEVQRELVDGYFRGRSHAITDNTTAYPVIDDIDLFHIMAEKVREIRNEVRDHGQKITHIGLQLNETRNDLSALGYRVDGMEIQHKRIVAKKRKDPSIQDQKAHLFILHHDYHGICPCCTKTKLLDSNGSPITANGRVTHDFEHWKDNAKADIKNTWVVCRNCNMDFLKDHTLRDKYEPHFKSYQLRVDKWVKPGFQEKPKQVVKRLDADVIPLFPDLGRV